MPKKPSDESELMAVGPWAQEKLDCLRKYLNAYTTILRKQHWLEGYFYIDAFAGPGSLKIRQEQATDPAQQSLLEVSEYGSSDPDEAKYVSGSPRVSLELKHPFTVYVFIELDKSRIAQLEALKTEFEGPERRIFIRDKDCNTYFNKLLSRYSAAEWQRRWRGVVFLDPFGMQVPWETIAAIAKTGAIEVILNFPVGMAIQRLLKRSGQFSDREREKLDQYFGTPDWYELLYERHQDLFGDDIVKVDNSGQVLLEWYIKRLEQIFPFVSPARLIRSTKGHPLYYLIHAGPNETGAKIAKAILAQGSELNS